MDFARQSPQKPYSKAAICGLNDQWRLDARSVGIGDYELHCRWDQYVGLGFKMLHAALDEPRISPNASRFGDMRAKGGNVDPGLIDDRAVALEDMGNQRSVH